MQKARTETWLALDPGTVERSVVERPPPGIARGVFPVSPAVVLLLALALALVTGGYYALRLRRARRR